MVESKPRNTTLKKLARWTPSAPVGSDNRRVVSIPPLSNDAPFLHVHHDKLQQGALYIIKIKQVSLAMFEGWNDDMCCFSVLRSEVEPLRWSEARQLPGDFDIYNAFDESGNPPIHLWIRYLKVPIPQNWFSMFEEAKHKQRDWVLRQQQQQQQQFGQGLIQRQQQNGSADDNYYSPPQQQQQQQQEDGLLPVIYSNTDVSTMSLNHHDLVSSSSIVVSTNNIDPNMMVEDDMQSQGTASHQSSSMIPYVTNRQSMNDRVLSPTPSQQLYNRDDMQQQQPERSSNTMDREQIRRHLAPGQAVITNRSPCSTPIPTTTTTRDSTLLAHHQSKELVYDGIQEQSPLIVQEEIQESIISKNEMGFRHNSDRFSIRSDIASSSSAKTSPTSPAVTTPNSMKPSLSSSKARNRASMKKMIWGQ